MSLRDQFPCLHFIHWEMESWEREREIAANTWHLSLSPVVSKREKSKHTFSFLPCPPHLILHITPNTWEHTQLPLLRCRQHNTGFPLPIPCRAGEAWLEVRFYAQGIERTSLLPSWRALEVVLPLEGKKSLAFPHSQKLSRKLRSSPLSMGKTLPWVGMASGSVETNWPSIIWNLHSSTCTTFFLSSFRKDKLYL